MALSDGSASAPSGTIPFSTLLSGYAIRPEWKVAGVDYYVGTPSGAVLKDPSTISMAGVTVDKSAHIVTVSASNVTLSGYDFGLGGGWQVNVVNNANNVTIQNSRFQVGANDLMPIQAYYGGTINVLNNTFDGGAKAGSSATAMVFTGNGGARIEYNRFSNFPNDGIDITHDGKYVVQYNLFDTMGAGGFHTDAIQTFFSSISSLSVQYNTMYQPASMSNEGINAFMRIGDEQNNVVHDPVAAFNTIIMKSTNAESANVFQWDSQGKGTLLNPQIHDNFVDPTGVMYAVVSPVLQNTDGSIVAPVTYNNMNLVTGKPLLNGPWNNNTIAVPAQPPAAPVITSESAVNSSQVKLVGTAAAGTTVNIFDQGHLVGSVKAGTGGAWSYTTSQLATGEHSFAARATDSYVNSSALSNAWSVSVTSSGTIGTPGGSTDNPPDAPAILSFSNDTGSSGDRITSDNTLELKGTAAANSTIKVFDGTKQIGSTTASATGAWDYITTALTDAKHVLTATATNGAGQSSKASAPLTVTVDTKAPAAPVLTSDSVVNSNQVKLSGTAEANSTIKVYDGNAIVGSGKADGTGTWTVTTSALSVGKHALAATATDAAGNVSGMSQALDPVTGGSTPAPAAPRILAFSTDSGAVGDHVTNDTTLTLSGSGQAHSTVLLFDGTKQVGTAATDSVGKWSVTTAALNDGLHHFTAIDVDGAGNKSVSSANFDVNIDSHAPAAPTLGVYTPSGSALGATTTLDDLLLKGTAEANSKVAIFDNGKQIGATHAGNTGTWSFDTGHIAGGAHSFTSKATDLAGNTSPASSADAVVVTSSVSHTSSAAPIKYTGLHGDVLNGHVNLTGSAEPGSLIKFYDNGNLMGSTLTKSYGGWSFTSSTPLSDRVHTITAQEFDGGGKVLGTSAGAIVVGSSSRETLKSTAGDDILSGHGGSDTFVFAAHFGRDVIKDFAATGPAHDVVQFSSSVFSDFASVLSHASQQGNDVVISAGADSLTLKWTKLGALNSHDFHFA
jgi:hypothetical protein